jgi:hypothetical protein
MSGKRKQKGKARPHSKIRRMFRNARLSTAANKPWQKKYV